jgi:hypothetical protein
MRSAFDFLKSTRSHQMKQKEGRNLLCLQQKGKDRTQSENGRGDKDTGNKGAEVYCRSGIERRSEIKSVVEILYIYGTLILLASFIAGRQPSLISEPLQKVSQ